MVEYIRSSELSLIRTEEWFQVVAGQELQSIELGVYDYRGREAVVTNSGALALLEGAHSEGDADEWILMAYEYVKDRMEQRGWGKFA